MTRAMLLAAGRGVRMRPLSDGTPKPLLEVGGKPLIVWQIEALARAGYTDLVVNAAHRAADLVRRLSDGAALGVRIAWSIEHEPLEVGGGIATALPLLEPGAVLIVSGDIWTGFDYASLRPRVAALGSAESSVRAHLVMVPNPAYHPDGDFHLSADGMVSRAAPPSLTYGNIGVYDTALFRGLPRGTRLPMLPLLIDWIDRRLVSGQRYDGPWSNVGTPDDLAQLDAELIAAARRTG